MQARGGSAQSFRRTFLAAKRITRGDERGGGEKAKQKNRSGGKNGTSDREASQTEEGPSIHWIKDLKTSLTKGGGRGKAFSWKRAQRGGVPLRGGEEAIS